MWCEVDQHFLSGCISELLLNLRCVSVACDTVRFHILIHFTEKVRYFCTTSCSGCSRFCIHDQGIHINDSFFCQWICGQDGTCCIASRIGYQSCILYIFSVDLTKPVHCFFNILWTLMLDSIPLFICSYIFDTIVCT